MIDEEAIARQSMLDKLAWYNVHCDQGDYRTGTVRVMGALSQATKLNDMGAQIRYLTLVGDGLIQLQRNDQAISMFDQALALAQTIPELGQPVMTYAGKAQALAALGRTAEAKKLLESVLEISHKRTALGYESEALLELAKLEERTGQDTQAIDHFRQAVAAATKVDGHNLISEADLELSKVLAKEKRYGEAELAAKESVEASRAIGDKLLVPRSLAQLAAVEESRGKYHIADQLFTEATEIVEAILSTTTTANAKSSVAGSMDGIFLGHFELAATKFGDVNKAYEIIETARGRALADTLRGESEGLTSSSDKISIEAQQEMNRIQLALMRQTNREERRLLLDELFAQEQLLSPAPKTRSLMKSAADRSRPVPLRNIQASLNRDEMLLEYVLGESQSYCLRLTRTGTTVLVIPAGRKRIEGLVGDYLRAVRSRETEIMAGQELFTLLVNPAIDNSSMTRVIIVPDGTLHLLPFDALKKPDGKYVLETHVITYAPSGTVLHLLRKSHGIDRPAISFLGIGDVIYPRPPAVSSNANTNPDSGEDEGPDFFSVNAVAFPELPGSRQEITSVADIMKAPKQLLLGPNATEAAFKSLPLSDFSVIHFAVHGLDNAQFPDRAGIECPGGTTPVAFAG